MTVSPKRERKLGDVYKGYTYFKDDDVLVAKVTPCFENGKGGIVRNLENGIGFGTSELYVLRVTENAIPLCDYNGETTPSNNLEYKAEEKMACLRIQMVR
jgi:hypothetical protein